MIPSYSFFISSPILGKILILTTLVKSQDFRRKMIIDGIHEWHYLLERLWLASLSAENKECITIHNLYQIDSF